MSQKKDGRVKRQLKDWIVLLDANSFGQTFPNCGTYFFKHISDGEEDVLDGSVSCIAEKDPNCNGILLPSSQGSAIDEVSNTIR